VGFTTLAQAFGSGTVVIARSGATFLRCQGSKRSTSFPGHLTRGTRFCGRITGRATLTLTTEIRAGATSTARKVRKRSFASPVTQVARGLASAAITTTRRISNLNLDHSSVERLSIKSQGLLESFDVAKLDISETLGALHLAVFNEADADDLTALKEFGDALTGSFIGKVSEVCSKRRSVRECLRKILTDGGVAWFGVSRVYL